MEIVSGVPTLSKPTTDDYLKTLFDFNKEWTCFADNEKGIRTYAVSNVTGAIYLSVNPIQPGQTRLDVNCSSYRNFPVEIDDLPLKDQIPYLDAHRTPYSTLVFSGKKSYHAVIALEESVSEVEYRHLAQWLHIVLRKIDHSVKNPSRLTRFPNGIRPETGKVQELIFVGKRISLTDFKAWLSSLTPEPKRHQPQTRQRCSISTMRGSLRRDTVRRLYGEWEIGDRNNALFKAACDFAEQNYAIDEAAEKLSVNFPFDNDFTEQEFDQTVQSAYAHVARKLGNPQPPATLPAASSQSHKS